MWYVLDQMTIVLEKLMQPLSVSEMMQRSL
jgi:hypothetical protein